MRNRILSSIVALATAAATVVACSGGADVNGMDIASGFEAGVDPSANGGGASCTPAPSHAPQDPSQFPAGCCADGAAHCVPSDQLSPIEISALASCAGGACVPDALIQSGGAKPPSCASLNGADGVCLSVCVPQVAQYKDLLPQATCAADERCAPCINPLTSQPSGACLIGEQCTGDGGDVVPPSGDAAPVCPYSGPPLVDPKTLPSCDPHGGAHCLGTSLVPPAMQSKLAACPADAGAGASMCVPDVFIAAGGNAIPATCASIDGAEGRCLHEQIPQVASQPDLPQGSCASYERCVPCFNPLDGTDTGACRLSCDPGPTEPKVVFADCCSGAGKCVPSSMVPASEASDLSQDTCTSSGDLCAPTENLEPGFKPGACTAPSLLYLPGGQYDGVCLSTCLKFTGINGLVVKQGTCDATHQCVPCKTPLGTATGAPGCPP